MPQNTLNQSQIDALAAAAVRKVEPYDYHVGKGFDSGTVAEICVENAQPVEFGQVLFRVEP